MTDHTELPQTRDENLDQLCEETNQRLIDDKFDPVPNDIIREQLTKAILLGKHEADESNLHANELVAEAMQKVVDKRHFDAQDLMAFLMLVNEYEGTDAQSKDTGMIFTTLNLSALGPKLAQYECAKFYLPNGMIEFQIIRKGQILAPATEAEL